MNRNVSVALLMAGASLACFSTVAQAQTAPTVTAPAGDQAAPPPPASQTPADTGNDVVVTGSRVIRNGNDSPTPITVVQAADLQTVQPTTISDGLNLLPVFSGSRSQYGNPNPAGGNGAANELNLRNLGANRNLILFDGHRVPPTLSDGTVDVDMIPQLLVQRVDVVTGGVSAVYGSDAISGVINFVPNRHFNGILAQAQGGVSQLGDDANQEVGVAVGTDLFGGRGHFEASYEYRNDDGVLRRSDRDWDTHIAVEGNGSAATPFQLLSNVRLATASFGGLINTGALAGMQFATNGVLSPFVHGTPTGSACCEVGGDGAYYDDSLKAPLRSHQVFGRFDYDFSNGIHFYVMGSGDFKDNAQYLDPPLLSNVTMSATNPYLAPQYQAALAAAGQKTFTFSEFMAYNAPREEVETKADQVMVNTGLEGKLGKFKWELNYTFGSTRQTTIDRNNYDYGKLYAALDAVKDPSGNIVCDVTLTHPGAYPGCVPLNPFGPSSASSQAVNYFEQTTKYVVNTQTHDVDASISGAPFDTWAGPLNVALSGEWRRQSFNGESNATPDDVLDCAVLRYNCTVKSGVSPAQYFRTFADRSDVSQSVWEGAFEADVPILRDVRFFKALDLNGAVRYTDYDTSGSYVTWKGGVDWHVDSDLTFRATKSRDIRAPTLNDLFAPTSVSSITNTDYLTGVSRQTPLVSGGNPNLKAEIGHTTTAGLVWTPHFVHGLSISLDWFNIQITNALSSELGYNVTLQNACYASGGSSPYCELQSRPNGYTDTDPSNTVTTWYNEQINLSQARTYGEDLEINYANEAFGRPFSIRLLTTYQPHLYFKTPGLPTLEHAGVAFATNLLYPTPKWRVSAFFNFKPTDNFTIDVLEKWRSPYTMQDDQTLDWVDPHIKALAQTNLNLAYDVKSGRSQFQIFLNISNLLDKDPPIAAFSGTQTRPGQYGGWAIGDDPIGRAFTFGVRVRR
jgi:outer membrane receptor protein involved in Fe transport